MPDRVALGKIVKTVGLKGEVKLLPTDDFWANALNAIRLELISGYQQRSVQVERHRRKKNTYILKFSGIDTIDHAESLVGQTLEIPKGLIDDSIRPEEILPFQLVGLKVIYSGGVQLGEITDLLLGSSQKCIVVSSNEGDIPVPFVPELIEKIDMEMGILELKDLPEGLMDLKL
jgi:16S rRNA processing protein RimM